MATFKKGWSTTHISLHERFTILRSQQQRQQETDGQQARRTLAAQRQTAARSQRTLLQMERRPAVMAALKIKQKSVRQRLGQIRGSAYAGRVTDRTTPGTRARTLAVGLRARSFRPQTQFASVRNQRAPARTRGIVRRSLPRGRNLLAMDSTPRYQSQNRPLFQVRMPLNRSQFQNKSQFQSSNQNQGRFQNQPRNRNQNQGRNQNRIQNQSQGRNQNRVQGRNQRRNPIQGRPGRGNTSVTQPFGKGRGNARAGQSGFKGNQGNQRNARGRPQQRGSFRRGQGRGRGRQEPPPSKEELDKQLDQYMASTKTSLDKELDTYMNQSDN